VGERFDIAGRANAAAMAQAHASLERGCGFLLGRADWALPELTSGELRVEMRRAGNCLRELDRFLCLLLDSCAAADGMPDGALVAFERSHDAARKLRRIADDDVAAQRLEAIARLRRIACGEQRGSPRGGHGRDLALATAGAVLGGVGALRLGEDALAAMARFYLALADRLVWRFGRSGVEQRQSLGNP